MTKSMYKKYYDECFEIEKISKDEAIASFLKKEDIQFLRNYKKELADTFATISEWKEKFNDMIDRFFPLDTFDNSMTENDSLILRSVPNPNNPSKNIEFYDINDDYNDRYQKLLDICEHRMILICDVLYAWEEEFGEAKNKLCFLKKRYKENPCHTPEMPVFSHTVMVKNKKKYAVVIIVENSITKKYYSLLEDHNDPDEENDDDLYDEYKNYRKPFFIEES